jgi:hypothetical protein
VDVSVVCVGADGAERAARTRAAVVGAGGGSVSVASTVECPDPADRGGLDRALDRASTGRLVLCAGVGDLAAVLRRLWRRGELVERETAWLPIGPVPSYLASRGVPASLAAAAAVAVTGSVGAVGLLADDSGGLTVGSAELSPWQGRRLWVRAFVDDVKVCDGEVSALRVDRPAAGVLQVSVLGRFGRTVARVDGRAAQLACDEAQLRSDGVPRERPRRKRTWWNEPDLWRLALPAPRSPVG